ncbi:MAG: endonuclease III [Janthinobacterium lividum]
MSPDEVRAFLAAIAVPEGDMQTELAHSDPFTLLVAVVLSAQATDASVNRATPALFAAAPDAAAMAALGADGIAAHIRQVGLWQSKARNLAGLAARLVERHAGAVPFDRESLEALPGVGRKTANVVLNVAFGEATMAVDTHVFRLGNRTGLAPGATVRAVEDALLARIPAEILRPAHHWLIMHGRYTCKARAPECWRCPAAAWCHYGDKATEPPTRKAKASKAGLCPDPPKA